MTRFLQGLETGRILATESWQPAANPGAASARQPQGGGQAAARAATRLCMDYNMSSGQRRRLRATKCQRTWRGEARVFRAAAAATLPRGRDCEAPGSEGKITPSLSSRYLSQKQRGVRKGCRRRHPERGLGWHSRGCCVEMGPFILPSRAGYRAVQASTAHAPPPSGLRAPPRREPACSHHAT